MKTAALLFLTSVLVAAGCTGCKPTPAAAPASGRKSIVAAQESEKLFSWAVQNLNRIEYFDASDERKQIVDRLDFIRFAKTLPPKLQSNLLLASWPQPDMLQQSVGRLNQWAESQDVPADWKRDPLLAELPRPLAEVPMLADLDKLQFTPYDGYAILESIWLRDVSLWARGKTYDELDEARRLFDWTIRNIQLDPVGPDHAAQVPWETLLFGHGNAMERAWVYILLLRQQGIDAAILAVPDGVKTSLDLTAKAPDDEDASPDNSRLRPWCVAVSIGEPTSAKLYLFDTALGLPIPAPDGIRIGPDGQLDIRPATLDQVMADPHVMDRLDSEKPYWVKGDDSKKMVLLVEASPMYLSARAKLLESRLVGADKLVLTIDATAQAQRMKSAGHIATARLWNLPYMTLHSRLRMGLPELARHLDQFLPFYAAESAPLFKGRVLHLKGRFFDNDGAIQYYQSARPPTQELVDAGPGRAGFYFKGILASTTETPSPQRLEDFKQLARKMAQMEIESIFRGKEDASYWLGIISYEQANLASALDYFQTRTLDAQPAGPWTSGAHYNIARCLEAKGDMARAIDEYKASVFSPLDIGNLLRARWLSDAASARNAKPKDVETSKK